MSFSERLSSADLPNPALSRRDLFGKTAAIALAAAATKLPPKPPASSKYPSPEFAIGDLIAQDWEQNDDDAPESATDFGEILGMRWVPEPDGYSLIGNTWVYYIRWTHSSCPGCLPEPYCDGEGTLSSDLRLVSRS